MKVVIDLDSHQAIQDFGNRSAAGTYQFKSQDTVEWELYFAQGGVVQDMGAGFALKFGMIKTGDTSNTLLAYQTAFTYKTDAAGNVYYSGLVNFNTSQMATAIGTATSIQGTAEVRYQDSLSEIIHSINISTVVYATILVESGVTPPGVSTGYPDASTIELLIHKNAVNGYAGLDADGDLLASAIPVDGQTIVVNSNGDLASASILANVAANFLTPASGGNVTVSVDSVTNLHPGAYVRIPIAGYYIVQSITTATNTAVLQNNGDPFNAASGVTITAGAVLLPAQAAAGGGGGTGQAAYTTLTAGFTVPAINTAVTLTIGSSAWMGGTGYVFFITGAGYYSVQSITDVNHVVAINLGTSANAVPGSSITAGATISASGPPGAAGAAGAALSAYDALSASFVMPAAAASVNISISNTAWVGLNQVLYISSAGYLQVSAINSVTSLTVTNLNYNGNAGSGTTIASGSKVSPGGLQGSQGSGGAGLNSFTTTTASFTQPASSANVTVLVVTTSWMVANEIVYVAGGGYYQVVTITDLVTVSLKNLGYSGNANAGATVPTSAGVSPGGVQGASGSNPFTNTLANFIMPAAGTSVSIACGSTAFMVPGQNLYIQNSGYFTVASITDSSHLVATNNGAVGNSASGATIPSGSTVATAGANGPAGAAGSPGPAGRDGAYATVYTGNSVAGTGGSATPVVLVNDAAQGTNPNAVYQRDASGNNLWGPIPTDGVTTTISAGKLKALYPPDAIGAHIETPSVKSYTLDLYAPVAYTILALVAVCGAGSVTVNLQRNGSTITGASALSITGTLSATTLSQAVTAGDKITLQVTATSSGADLQVSMKIQK